MLISAIIPVFNEEESIKPLYELLSKNIVRVSTSYELIFIDDGSFDRSNRILRRIAVKDKKVIVVGHKKKLGKAAALGTGLDFATGEVIITLDSDLQDDPKEIPNFINKVIQGCDLVVGWRRERHDHPIKIITSKLMNLFVICLSRVKVHDFYCGIRAFRHEIVNRLDLYGDLYRFVPLFLHLKKFRISEIPVRHHPREFGYSKYGGLKRFRRALSDIAIILLVINYERTSVFIFVILLISVMTMGFFLGFYDFKPLLLILIQVIILLFLIELSREVIIRRQMAKDKDRKANQKIVLRR